MATYFHGNSEIQSAASGTDGLQTLVLMNPTGYISYADTPPPPPSGNLVFLNSAASSLAHHHHHAPPPQQQAQHFAAGGDMAAAFHHGFLPQRVHYNLWTPPPETASPTARDAARAGTRLQQGLSLTLSSQQLGFGSPHAPASGDDARVVSGGSSAVSGVTNGGAAGIQSVLVSSKYLKAAQELLEEVVNVGAGIGGESGRKSGSGSKGVGESSGAGDGSGEGSGKRTAAELSPGERQEVEMKKAKLMSMLEEVEQRYRQYQEQMEMVIRWFEQAAGMGSARTYTALALETISKQFRCLKDGIAGQMGAAAKRLGEEEGGRRVKLVEQRLRQQLGMIQHNAWRPQRGLPERSVSVLRAWLFEHFLHPYPKDSDKHLLAKQTGLSRSQVSNWFINARVRLWKPMVEEMYLEEIKDQEHTAPPSPHHSNLSKDTLPDGIAAGNSPKKARCSQSPNGHLAIDVKPAKSNDNSSQVCAGRDGYAFMGGQANFVGGFGQYPIAEIGRPFEADHFAPRYSGGSSNGSNGVVSLTLGLPHCDPQQIRHLSLAGGAHHQGFMLAGQAVQLGGGRRIDHHHMGEVADHQFGAINTSPHPHSSSAAAVAFDGINIQNPKRFAAQLLPDYVA